MNAVDSQIPSTSKYQPYAEDRMDGAAYAPLPPSRMGMTNGDGDTHE